MKIGFIGSAGTARTTVALEVSKYLNIPYVSSRSITQPILEKEGYDYSGCIETFLAKKGREQKLIKQRINIEKKYDTFITDRTTLDNFAYLLLCIEDYTEAEIVELEQICYKNILNFDYIFYFERSDIIKRNGIRTVNRFFQRKIDYLILGLIKDWKISVYTVKNIGVNEKIKFVLNVLENE